MCCVLVVVCWLFLFVRRLFVCLLSGVVCAAVVGFVVFDVLLFLLLFVVC